MSHTPGSLRREPTGEPVDAPLPTDTSVSAGDPSAADGVGGGTVAAHARWGRRRPGPLQLVVLAIVLVLVIPPLLGLLFSSLAGGQTIDLGDLTLDNYRRLFQDSAAWSATWRTGQFALLATTFAVILAGTAAWLTERTNARLRGLVYAATLASFAVPGIIKTLGWTFLLGPRNGVYNVALRGVFGEDFTLPLYSIWGMSFVQSMVLFPLMYLLMVPAFKASDASLEEAAMVSGASRFGTLRRVTLPLIGPSVLAGAMLGIILSIEAFEVPALIGTPGGIQVLSTEILGRIKILFPDYGAATSFAVVLMVLASLGLVVYHRATKRAERYATVTGKGYRPATIDLGRGRPAGTAFNVGVATLLLSPVFVIAWAAVLPRYQPPSWSALEEVGLGNFRDALASSSVVAASRNSLVLGVVAAVVIMTVTIVGSWLTINRRDRASRLIDQLGSLPLVIPGIVLSLAMLRAYLRTPIYGTITVLLLAYIVHYLPYGMRFSYAGLLTIHRDLQEAAYVNGARGWTLWRRVLIPLLTPSLLAGGLFIFLATVRQLSVAVFLGGPGREVASLHLYNLWDQGTLGIVSAYSAMIVAVTVSVAIVAYLLTRGRGVQVH